MMKYEKVYAMKKQKARETYKKLRDPRFIRNLELYNAIRNPRDVWGEALLGFSNPRDDWIMISKDEYIIPSKRKSKSVLRK